MRKAVSQSPLYDDAIKTLVDLHISLANTLLGGDPASAAELASFIVRVQADADDMRDISHALFITRHITIAVKDLLLAYGEIWSALLFASYLRSRGVRVAFLDARDVLCVELPEGGVGGSGTRWRPDVAFEVNWRISSECLARFVKGLPDDGVDALVITGYIARSAANVTVTLERKGSDFSASVFGHLLKASEITLWTDFDGIFTAEPTLVKGATLIEEMSYSEALEFSFYSNLAVVHSKTMMPAVRDKIPIRIRNSFNRQCRGTKIHAGSKLASGMATW